MSPLSTTTISFKVAALAAAAAPDASATMVGEKNNDEMRSNAEKEKAGKFW